MPPKKMPLKRRKITTHARVVEPAVEAENLPENQAAARDTVTLKRSHLYAGLTVLTFALGVLVGYFIWGYGTPQPGVYKIETRGAPSLGPDDAPIVIVEFSDYQCPYCAKWYAEVFNPLLQQYPEQVRIVFRNYPLSFHQNAVAAAEAALCAGDQDAYWKFHNELFENNAILNSQDGSVLGLGTYSQFARDLGLDLKAFEKCMSEHKYKEVILDDMNYAENLPPDKNGEKAVGGTPTFFINEHRLGGAYPIEYFQQIIDAELAK